MGNLILLGFFVGTLVVIVVFALVYYFMYKK